MRKLAFPITTLRQQLPPFGRGLRSLRRQPPGSDAAVVCMCVCMSVCMCVCVITCTHQQLRPLTPKILHGPPLLRLARVVLARALSTTSSLPIPSPSRPADRCACISLWRTSAGNRTGATQQAQAQINVAAPDSSSDMKDLARLMHSAVADTLPSADETR